MSDVNFRFGTSGAADTRAIGSRGAFATRAVAAVLLLAAGGVAGAWVAARAGTAQGAASGATVRFTLPMPGDTTGGLYLWGDRALEVSPDGDKLVAVGSRAGGGTALFVREMADVEWREMTGTDGALNPEFSPDGGWLAFIRGDAMVKMPVSGGPVARLASIGEDGGKPSWGPNGRIVLSIGSRLATIDANGGVPRFVPDADSAVAQLGRLYPFVLAADVWYQSTAADATRQPVATTSAVEHSPRFSPDGRWIAYTSNESGKTEVYVRAFPISTSPIRVSVDGAREPAWSRDGRHLFYRNTSRIVRATVRTAPEFTVVSREVVLTGYDGEDGVTGYDVAPNGRDFVIKDLTVDNGRIVVVHGWTRELRERFPKGTP